MSMVPDSLQSWLHSLALDQYLATLQDGGFDELDKCNALTEDQLDRLGITLQGHKRRILAHLPSMRAAKPAMAKKPVPNPPVEDQIYDVPPRTPSVMSFTEDDIYENTAAVKDPGIPMLPPKMGKSRDSTGEVVGPVSQEHTKQPVPVPRKRPIPRPRTSKGKSSSPVNSSASVVESTVVEGNDQQEMNTDKVESQTIAQSPAKEEEVMVRPQMPPRRKLSIQLSGATVSESDLDKETIKTDDHLYGNFDARSSDHDDRDGVDGLSSSAGASVGNEYSLEPLAARPPTIPPPLSMDEIEFFERLDSGGTSKETPDTETMPEYTPDSTPKGPPVLPSPTAEVMKSILDTKTDPFDVTATIPSSLDEWDKATSRKSLMVGTKPVGSEVLELRPSRDNSPVDWSAGNNSAGSGLPPPTHQCKLPAGDTDKTATVEYGMELYDAPLDVNKNFYVSHGSRESEASATTNFMDTSMEEDENKRNESLAARVVKRSDEPSSSETYEAMWTMTTKSKQNKEDEEQQDSFDLPPPPFAPPPLPPSNKAVKSDSNEERSPKPCKSPGVSASEPEKRNIPPMPSRAAPMAPILTPTRAPMPAPSTRAPLPIPGERAPVPTPGERAPVPTPGERAPVPTPTERPPAHVPHGSSPQTSPRGAMPLPKTPGSSTPPPPPVRSDKTQLTPPLDVRSKKKPEPLTIPGDRQSSFTMLALDRVTNPNPAIQTQVIRSPESAGFNGSKTPPSPGRVKIRPKPPPRTDNPFKPMFDPVRGTYSMDEDFPPPSPSAYDDIHSDDTLSDGGDFFDLNDPGFTKPSIEVLKEAVRIVPAVQSKTAGRQGYLYKKGSQDTIKRMGGVWTKRWVTLDAKKLKYFSSKKHSITKRIIPVASMLNIEQELKTGESHQNQFQIITVDRIYTFAAENRDDLTLWTNMLMLAIIEMKNVDFLEGGDMGYPDKEGHIKMDGVRQKRYFVLKDEVLCYYNTMNDYRAGTPIAEIEMKLATVKSPGKQRLEIITPHFSKILIMDSDEELNKWKAALEEAIAEGLGDDSVLNEVYENHSNRFCADCSASGPQWASINIGITLCKHCAGIHRMLTFPLSKIRSLRMDFKVWKPSLVRLMQTIGNDNANNFWQWHLQDDDKLDQDADMMSREHFIIFKYRNKRYCRLHPLNGDQSALNEALHKSVQFQDVLETMQLFFTGGNLLSTDTDAKTTLELAQEYKQTLQAEFLHQNGAQGSGQVPVTTSMILDHMVEGGCLSISHKGYLYKTGSNPKGDFLKRFCILERGELAYYENEKSNTAKDKIDRAEMLAVAPTTDHRYEFTFELYTTRGGRVYQFAAELEEDRRKWVNFLAKSIAPVPQGIAFHIGDFERAGVVYMKKGANGEWNRCWLQWKNQVLLYYVKGLSTLAEIDCRKIKSMSLIASADDCCKETYENGPMFTINFQSSESVITLYIQGEISKETQTWYKIISKATKESGRTLQEQPLTSDNIPVLVSKCINFVSLHGMTTQGIYRLSGQHSKVTGLLAAFQQDARGVTLKLEDYVVHDVATVLKRFFRTLSDPLLTSELYSRWVNNTGIQELGVRMEWYQYHLKDLPEVNYCTLKKLIFHLARVAEQDAENKMSITNIAAIFGPIVMRVDKESDDEVGYASTSQEIAVFKDLMDNHLTLFEVKDRELQQEKVIETAKNKIQHLIDMRVKSPVKATEMLLPIYVISRDREMFSTKVTSETTAAQLMEEVLPKAKVPPNKQYAIYECICKEELERPLHHQEKVLAVTLRWGEWPEDLRKDNILCIKENHVYENIDLVFDPHSSLFSELRYSSTKKKGFSKFCFEFSQMKMSYKKDARATDYICSWNIEDLTVYVGIQQKRSPPHGWGFTFIKNDEKVIGPYFGQSVCCNSKEELYRWLAAILHGQNPMGLKAGGRSAPDGASCPHCELWRSASVDELENSTASHYSLETAVTRDSHWDHNHQVSPPGNNSSSLHHSPSNRVKGFKASIMQKFKKRLHNND